MKKITVALAGNPNSGKTTVFNNMTGYRQHVGNYPGVTVDKKEGVCKYQDFEMTIVDLPGTYSLTAYSIEEVVTRDFIIDEGPDVVVDIIDSSNLERNLFLATQLIDLKVPLILAFNMSDIAAARGIEFDLEQLSILLGAPIVPLVGSKGKGRTELLDAIVKMSRDGTQYKQIDINYGREIEEELAKIESVLESEDLLPQHCNARWVAIKLLENDLVITEKATSPRISETVIRSVEHLTKVFGDHPETIIADRRYGFISGACQEVVRVSVEARHDMSDKIDSVVTNRVLGVPIFLVLMYLAFYLTFKLGAPPMGWIEQFFGWLGGTIEGLWPAGSESALQSLLIDGVIGGVGGVIVFLPNILLLFLSIAIIEDSGYMARAAFIMDQLMHKIGLHGKSFIPLIIGFGCTVPAIMATRILDTRRDRLTTMMVAPLMSCGARLSIYSLIIPAFFPQAWRAPMLWGIYLIGIGLAILAAKVLRVTLLRGESTPLVMELPPYRMPTAKGVLIHMWERGREYVKKAGTIILAISIVLWALTSYPKLTPEDSVDDGDLAQARAVFIDGVRALNHSLDLQEKLPALLRAVDTELGIFAAEQSDYGSESSAMVEDPVFEPQRGDSATGSFDHFFSFRETVLQARKVFSKTIDSREIEEGSTDFILLQHGLDKELNRLEAADQKIYTAVMTFLDGVEVPYANRLAEIERVRLGTELAHSYAGRMGNALEPILRPMGFDWRIGTALIGAFAAKEVFVAQMGIVFAVGEADERSDALRAQLRGRYSPLVAFCIMLFSLVSTPCVATIVVTRKESGSWKWAFLQLGGLTLLAYLMTVAVYQLGTILGVGTTMIG